MIDKVKKIFENQIDSFDQKKYLLAISGGIDSMVLLYIFQELKLNFEVAHCNFNLRAEESESETNFVKNYCNRYNIFLHIKYFNTEDYAYSHKVSIQIAARELRYTWFRELLHEQDIDYLITAHHLNDQLETFFINVLRATSVNGLTGIPLRNEQIFRPLLMFSRDEIYQFAQQHHIEWKEDSSNASTKYIRNKIRHEIVPVLEQISPDLYANFQKLFHHLEEDLLLKKAYIQELITKYCFPESSYTRLRWDLLQKEADSFVKLKHILLTYGFDDENEIAKLLQAHTGKSIFSNQFELLKDREQLLIKTKLLNNSQNITFFIEKNESKEIISLIFESPFREILTNKVREITLDKDRLVEPISIRKPYQGETFQPLGLKGRKKISKYLKDLKLSKFDKENIRVLVDGNDKIVWVIGYQIDDYFKVNENTQKTIKIITT